MVKSDIAILDFALCDGYGPLRLLRLQNQRIIASSATQQPACMSRTVGTLHRYIPTYRPSPCKPRLVKDVCCYNDSWK